MNLISNQLSTTSIKYLNWPSPVFERFQNGCNKVVIEPLVVKFWSKTILVISNRIRAAYSFNFEIMHMISAQIALHSVQLPLFIAWFNWILRVDSLSSMGHCSKPLSKEKHFQAFKKEEYIYMGGQKLQPIRIKN